MHPDLPPDCLQNVKPRPGGPRRLRSIPAARRLDQRLEAARDTVAASGWPRRGPEATRREKDLATALARLARYKDQLLEVKTNREYQAMLHEIEAAQSEVRGHEDRILETMLEADELTAAIRQGEEELKSVEREAAVEREVINRELTALQADLDRSAASRTSLAAAISPAVLSIFEQTARSRKGVAVAEARDGLCTICHVRLRPQVFNEILRNDSIIQCDSCRRILYHAGVEQPARSDP